MTHYVSLLVHEAPDVVADQLENLDRFFPGAVAMVHVSASAAFTPAELTARLARSTARNWVVQEEQAPTMWGDIVSGLLINLRAALAAGDATSVSFHASNDLLVRSGVGSVLERSPNLWNRRLIDRASRWYWVRGLRADAPFLAAVRELGGGPIRMSQIEGTSYTAESLASVLPVVEEVVRARRGADLPPYANEELYFPTLAEACGARPSGRPYVYSEIFKLERVSRPAVGLALPGVLSRVSLRKYEALSMQGNQLFMKRVAPRYGITRDDVDRIRAQRHTPGQLAVIGPRRGPVYDSAGLFGVKRVERRMDDPLRQYIASLPA